MRGRCRGAALASVLAPRVPFRSAVSPGAVAGPCWPPGTGAVLVRGFPGRRWKPVALSPRVRSFAGGSAPAPVRFPRPSPRCRTQGRELGNTGSHTRAESCPCVRCVFRKSGSLCAYPGGRSGTRPRRAWPCVVGIVRGSSTPRGGYNARQCRQRASVSGLVPLVSACHRRQRRGGRPRGLFSVGRSRYAARAVQRGPAPVRRAGCPTRAGEAANVSAPVTHPPGHSPRAPAAWGRASRARARVSASSGRSSR